MYMVTVVVVQDSSLNMRKFPRDDGSDLGSPPVTLLFPPPVAHVGTLLQAPQLDL